MQKIIFYYLKSSKIPKVPSSAPLELGLLQDHNLWDTLFSSILIKKALNLLCTLGWWGRLFLSDLGCH